MASKVINPVDGEQIVAVAKYYSDVARTSLVDPTTVTFRVQSESMAGEDEDLVYGVDSEVTRRSLGIYELRYNVDESGLWYVRDESTGPVHAHEQAFRVRKSAFDAVPGGGS